LNSKLIHMKSINHFKISAILSPVAVAAIFGTSNILSFLILAIYGLSLGVLIDLDHFLWARYNEGHWDHLRDALKSPSRNIRDNEEVLGDAIGEQQRYLSHFIILVLGTGLAYLGGVNLAALTSIMLGTHVLSDIYTSYQEGAIQL
jgi:hypothetical protein